MTLTPANVGRILAGVVLLFAAFFLGGFIGVTLRPESVLVGWREPLSGKIGCSVAILAVAVLMRRYLLRSTGLAVLCILATEAIVFVIIMSFSGLTEFTLTDIGFIVDTLYAITWNVVVAFLFGTVFGHFWDRKAASKSLEATAGSPPSSDLKHEL